jgi:hypothetical protein
VDRPWVSKRQWVKLKQEEFMAEQLNEITEGSEEYNAQMASKFNNQEADQEEVIERLPVAAMPESGSEKFYNAETGEYDWENHAKELAYRLEQSKPKQEGADVEDKSGDVEPDQQEVKDIYTAAGLKQSDLEQSLQENGDITEDQYNALAKAGVPRELVEGYVSNLMYRREGQTKEAKAYAGGDEAWEQLSNWAQQSLTESEITEYNSLLAGPNWRIGLDAMKVRMNANAANANEPRLVTGEQSQIGSTFGYRSKSEMKADMSKPEYQTDPAFRQQVMQKIASATWDLQ